MGYLIGGAGEGPEKELEVSKSSQYEIYLIKNY
jgi:hypothetical protein